MSWKTRPGVNWSIEQEQPLPSVTCAESRNRERSVSTVHRGFCLRLTSGIRRAHSTLMESVAGPSDWLRLLPSVPQLLGQR